MIKANVITQIETLVHAIPAPGVSLEELVVQLREAGQEIIEVDVTNNWILIAQKVEKF